MMNHQLTEAIARRNIHNIRKLGKPPIWKHPRAQEILYRQFVIAIVDALRRHTLDMLARVPSVIAQRDSETHTDAWPDNLESLLNILRVNFDDTVRSERIKARLLDIGQKTSDWNDKEWQNTLQKVLGVDVFRREAWLGSHIKSFVNENSSLITKLTEDTYQDISTLLERSIRSGDRVETIKDALLTETDLGPGVFNKVETRARLIARDQIGKLNGELTKVRQQAIGVKTYRWHTVLDERVRDSHKSLDGMLCDWDDDTIYSDDEGETWKQRSEIDAFEGKPGDDYQCRCWAEAIFPEEELTEEELTEEEETPSNTETVEIGATTEE